MSTTSLGTLPRLEDGLLNSLLQRSGQLNQGSEMPLTVSALPLTAWRTDPAPLARLSR